MKKIPLHEPVSPRHAAALQLAEQGFKIMPLAGKVPLLSGWPKHATHDIEQVDLWWKEYPEANIGAKVFDGHVVMDIDPRNGGDETWEEMNQGQTLPETLTTLTGSGGRHFWYKLPYDLPVKGKAGDGVDLKNSKGQAVMPGSIHPATGRPYRWLTFVPVAVLPDHLLSAVYRLPSRSRTRIKMGSRKNSPGLLRYVVSAAEGERNNRLFWAACRALEEGWDLEEALRETALTIGLEAEEIDRTLNSARSTVTKA